ncbi:MAG: outer membrane lipoprotein-sorting protein [Gammaproteobacteria bacterium]|nr:MAG: outer membrane lipoprotein-sorting protein [Gammaproteobacteria bacterium]
MNIRYNRKGVAWLVLLGVVFLNGIVLAGSAEEQGLALARQVYDAPRGDDFAGRAIMTLRERGSKPRSREMLVFHVQKRPGERWSLTRFLKPADVRGVAVLTRDHPGDKSEQWLYLPALGRVRRISASRKGGRFVGSDVYFEDLRDREVEMDRHRYLGKRKLGKIVCKVLESVPVDPDNSVYTKRVSWIHPKSLLALRVDFYQAHSSKPVKRLQARRIRKVQGVWTVMDSVMKDLESGHRTRIRYTRVKYNQKLPDGLFTSRSLADERAGLAYAP